MLTNDVKCGIISVVDDYIIYVGKKYIKLRSIYYDKDRTYFGYR